MIAPLCRQAVTVYRDFGRVRQVLTGCCYQYEEQLAQGVAGERMQRKFLLLAPGEDQVVFPGDRIFDGIGPEKVDWQEFTPEKVPGLSIAKYAKLWRWDGKLCHTEAGNG